MEDKKITISMIKLTEPKPEMREEPKTERQTNRELKSSLMSSKRAISFVLLGVMRQSGMTSTK